MLKQIQNSDRPAEVKQRALAHLAPVASPATATSTTVTTVETPAPQATATRTVEAKPKATSSPVTQTRGASQTAEPVPSNSQTADSRVSGGVIAGIVLALLGAVAAGVGWWYSNGGQLPQLPKLPF